MDSKKVVFISLLIIGIISFHSCDPEWALNPKFRGHWVVKNSTPDTLKLLFSNVDLSYVTPYYHIIPPDSIEDLFFLKNEGAGIGNSTSEAEAGFDSFYASATGREDSIVVYSSVNKKLKVWREFDRGLLGKQFFNEASWIKQIWESGVYTHYEWTFEITPEDIAP
jgi:hypothetical protein